MNIENIILDYGDSEENMNKYLKAIQIIERKKRTEKKNKQMKKILNYGR